MHDSKQMYGRCMSSPVTHHNWFLFGANAMLTLHDRYSRCSGSLPPCGLQLVRLDWRLCLPSKTAWTSRIPDIDLPPPCSSHMYRAHIQAGRQIQARSMVAYRDSLVGDGVLIILSRAISQCFCNMAGMMRRHYWHACKIACIGLSKHALLPLSTRLCRQGARRMYAFVCLHNRYAQISPCSHSTCQSFYQTILWTPLIQVMSSGGCHANLCESRLQHARRKKQSHVRQQAWRH